MFAAPSDRIHAVTNDPMSRAQRSAGGKKLAAFHFALALKQGEDNLDRTPQGALSTTAWRLHHTRSAFGQTGRQPRSIALGNPKDLRYAAACGCIPLCSAAYHRERDA